MEQLLRALGQYTLDQEIEKALDPSKETDALYVKYNENDTQHKEYVEKCRHLLKLVDDGTVRYTDIFSHLQCIGVALRLRRSNYETEMKMKVKEAIKKELQYFQRSHTPLYPKPIIPELSSVESPCLQCGSLDYIDESGSCNSCKIKPT